MISRIVITLTLLLISICSNAQNRNRISLNPHDINYGRYIVDSAVIRIYTDTNYYENSLSVYPNSYIIIDKNGYRYDVNMGEFIVKNEITMDIFKSYTPESIFYISIDNGDIIFINNNIIKIDNVIGTGRVLAYYYIRGGSIQTIKYKDWNKTPLDDN